MSDTSKTILLVADISGFTSFMKLHAVSSTGEIYDTFENFYGINPERRLERFEGVGEIETLVFYPADVVQSSKSSSISNPMTSCNPSFFEKVGWTLRLTLGSALDLIGLSKVKGIFKNLPA